MTDQKQDDNLFRSYEKELRTIAAGGSWESQAATWAVKEIEFLRKRRDGLFDSVNQETDKRRTAEARVLELEWALQELTRAAMKEKQDGK